MEDLDRRIVELLSADGRMSYTEIGRITGLSTSAAQQRVRRLEQRGIIRGYVAQVDPSAFGHLLTAFIDVSPYDASQEADVPAIVRDLHEVVSCYSVAGESDYVLKVQVTSPDHLEEVLREVSTRAHVSTRTTLVLSVPFENRPNLHPGRRGDA